MPFKEVQTYSELDKVMAVLFFFRIIRALAERVDDAANNAIAMKKRTDQGSNNMLRGHSQCARNPSSERIKKITGGAITP